MTSKIKSKRQKLPEVTPEYVDTLIFLHRCAYFKAKGQGVDPRTIEGAVELFGSAEELDRRCTEVGL